MADVLLYDRLVIPVPPPGDEQQRQWWEQWQPGKLEDVVKQLGDLAVPVEWDGYRRAQWHELRERYPVSQDVASEVAQELAMTRGVLTKDLPSYVTGVESLAAYRSLEDMTRELGLRESPAMVSLPSGAVTAILGREFLVPNDDRSDDVLLNHAIEIAQDKDFRQKRTNFQRWQREFVRDGVTDEASVKKAVEEMRDLIADEQRAVRSKQISVGIQFSLMVGSLVCGVLAAPLAPIAIAGAFMSIGQFAADKWMPAGEDGTVSAGAAFYSAQKRLGWR